MTLSVQKLPMTGECIAIRHTTPWTATTVLRMLSAKPQTPEMILEARTAAGEVYAAVMTLPGRSKLSDPCPVLPGYACE